MLTTPVSCGSAGRKPPTCSLPPSRASAPMPLIFSLSPSSTSRSLAMRRLASASFSSGRSWGICSPETRTSPGKVGAEDPASSISPSSTFMSPTRIRPAGPLVRRVAPERVTRWPGPIGTRKWSARTSKTPSIGSNEGLGLPALGGFVSAAAQAASWVARAAVMLPRSTRRAAPFSCRLPWPAWNLSRLICRP